ncbi:hypothetical protein Y032_0561g3480 [Ancylostoma ceylanicum]|uniref:Receptor expression-enhancing protein n=1 Tax=Ancylostoma ceylanicum TaxID=53326 RepID=A0A016WPA8_9BILA|nr:hypothetical protein Y032_0561g3480 [Ancylostoma ceylanicum]
MYEDKCGRKKCSYCTEKKICQLRGTVYLIIRNKKSGEAIGQLLYWVPFGFFALLDSTSFSLIPAYFLLRTALLLFLFLPQTQGAQLIFTKVIEPIAKAVEGFLKKA